MEEILRFEKVAYSYDGEREALRSVDVRVTPGERIAILGNNGAGKSTFFLCANGILKPQKGKIFLEGKEIRWKKREIMELRQKIGLVFQEADSQLIAGTVEAEVSFGPMNLGIPEDEVRERVEDAIDSMGLEKFRQRAPHYLSGGEKKRVSIADVLAMHPRLMLLDEPASSLDPSSVQMLKEHLDKLSKEGMSLVIATHDVDFAWEWAERILLFHEGMIEADGRPEEIFAGDELLERCGLRKPLLFQAGQIYGLRPLPRTIDELKKQRRKGTCHPGKRSMNSEPHKDGG